jgi:L-lactate dehydrogenase complex protein LldG
VGGDILTPDELAGLRGATAFAEDDVPKSALEGFVATDNVWSAEIGFSMAVGAIAETGSLILVAGPGKPRLASLAPPHNIIVLRRSVIVETAEDAFANLPRETTVVVTGPSRTADIEGTLVRGIHGPKRLSVLLLD